MERIYRLDKIVLRITKADKLLGNVTSNTLDAEKNALLDRFGKIVVTFNQIKHNNFFFIVIGKKFYERFMTAIKMYLKLTKAKVVKTNCKVYFDLDKKYKAKLSIPQNKGQLIITKEELDSNITEEEFTLFRLKNNIPIQGIDYENEMLLNVSEEFVSYGKGCFLGQEVIARVYYKSKPPKKLAVVENLENMTSRVKDPKTGKELGFAFIENK